jgi:hypothetical protein
MDSRMQPREDRILEWIRFRYSQEFSNELLVRMSPSYFADTTIIELKTGILGERRDDRHYRVPFTHTYTVPETTFQVFKYNNSGRWWMRWFVRRYPIKTGTQYSRGHAEVDLTEHILYPYQAIANRKLGPYVRVAETQTSIEWSPDND